MRIGIDARMVNNTGIGRYLRNLLRQLARLDRQNEYFLFLNKGERFALTQENFTAVSLKISVPLYSLREQYWLPLEIRRCQSDIMHYPNFDLPVCSPAPYIVTVHDLIYFLYPEQCPSRLAHYYARAMLAHSTKRARVVVTDSEYSKQDLQYYFRLPAEKIRVILPAADERAFPGEPNPALLAQYDIIQPYILYVGKHHAYKNVMILMRAYMAQREIHQNFQLVIAGKKDPRQKALYDAAEQFDCGKRILFTDFVPDEDLFDLYRGARLFAFPSRYEGFGLPPLEAMACGVPVICSNAASLPEVVGDAAIQVQPENISALADAICSVLTNENLWQTLKNKGLTRAQQFSWETSARQLLKVYQDAAETA
ncbi:glycosyl transferase group 1 [Candidatus Vecturithrix granuli]|uniref:Glycosyl transferase group 1 n=1 Tax=Vecturithrix granuli TaxID=1499967 RepID=A0A081BTR9_VECG1|nr:glycosyl transferase group 1 [Candidatus Vecturithrix granuli]